MVFLNLGSWAACRPLCRWLAGALGLCWAASVSAQLTPSGYSGAFNTPTAEVLPWGQTWVSYTNNNPEMVRRNPGAGLFGSLNMAMGLVPGLELSGRLATEGDINCNQFAPGCRSSMRDLSFNAKYALPLELPGGAQLAVGLADYGGAATNFRHAFGVASVPVGTSAMVSLGYANTQARYPLLSGGFFNAQWFMTDNVQSLLEYDSQRWRAGVRVRYPLTDRWSMQAAWSTRLQADMPQQRQQLSFGLTYALEKPQQHASGAAVSQRSHDNRYWQAAQQALPATVPDLKAPPPAPAPPAPTEAPQRQAQAQSLKSAYEAAGFGALHIGWVANANAAARHWVVRAEPAAWRHGLPQALGQALSVWLQAATHDDDTLTLTLSRAGADAVTVATSLDCLRQFKNGMDRCDHHAAIDLQAPAHSSNDPTVQWHVMPTFLDQVLPTLEIGPALEKTLGTEVGLMDYQLGVDLGWQLPLGAGWQWQGNLVAPVAQSDDFRANGAFANYRLPRGVESSLLSRSWQPWRGTFVQASAGAIRGGDVGGQWDMAHWAADGRLRLGATLGSYHSSTLNRDFRPQWLQAQYSLIPGKWSAELTAGQFYWGDKGFRVASQHWFDQHRVTLFLSQTGADTPGTLTPKTRVAGLQLTIPFGGDRAAQLGRVTVAGRDQWPVSVQSKVGGTDNRVSRIYAVMPVPRHGLADLTDHDRAAPIELWARRNSIREAMR